MKCYAFFFSSSCHDDLVRVPPVYVSCAVSRTPHGGYLDPAQSLHIPHLLCSRHDRTTPQIIKHSTLNEDAPTRVFFREDSCCTTIQEHPYNDFSQNRFNTLGLVRQHPSTPSTPLTKHTVKAPSVRVCEHSVTALPQHHLPPYFGCWVSDCVNSTHRQKPDWAADSTHAGGGGGR